MDTVVSFTYWREDDELSSSGWSDGEIALKYRFLGDGDGPTNMGIEGIFTLPSGEAEKDLRGSDEIVPTAFLFGTVGVQDFRVLMNAGATFNPDEHDVALYGLAFEWTATESWTFVSEIYGENDFEHGGGNDPFEGGVGAVWGVNDALTLSGGVSFGLNEYAPDTRFTLAALIGW